MNLTTNQQADLNKKIDGAEKKSEKFLSEIGYSKSGNEISVDEVFIEAVKKYLTNSKENIWALAYIAAELEANPDIHDAKLVNEIYLAIDLQFYLVNLKDRVVKKNVRLLKEFRDSL